MSHQRGHVGDEIDIIIQPKLIDINTETYWELVDRLYAQCERAMVSLDVYSCCLAEFHSSNKNGHKMLLLKLSFYRNIIDEIPIV